MRDIYEVIDGLDPADRDFIERHTGASYEPDVILAPDGDPYLYRWHLLYDNTRGNVFLHLQVKSDPERPLHDHPWDNVSVVIVGGYDELYASPADPAAGHPLPKPYHRSLRKGDVVRRDATTAHRLILPAGIPYTITLFTTGPKLRDWGFWYPDGWHHNKRHVNDRMVAGRGISIGEH